MAKKISELTPFAGTIDGTEDIPIVSGGTTYKTNINKISSDKQLGALADAAVTTAKIADAAVTNSKLAAEIVTTNKIADSAIITSKLANQSLLCRQNELGKASHHPLCLLIFRYRRQ